MQVRALDIDDVGRITAVGYHRYHRFTELWVADQVDGDGPLGKVLYSRPWDDGGL